MSSVLELESFPNSITYYDLTIYYPYVRFPCITRASFWKVFNELSPLFAKRCGVVIRPDLKELDIEVIRCEP